MTKIPNNLKECRNRAKLRQIDVAEALGFKTTDRISRWEKGRAYPHIVNVFKMARLYQVTVEELFRVEHVHPINPLMEPFQETYPHK
jgi:transcriptional regulator with XRE-family HTH domain